MTAERGDARGNLLDAALALIRAQGYAATSVDALCRAAGVTKGAFFHHFRSKEALAVAAAAYFVAKADPLFAAPWRDLPDPAARVLGYLVLRRALIGGDIASFTCLLGTMAQEAYATSPAIRDACGDGVRDHTLRLAPDIAAALAAAGRTDVSAESLALHVQAAIQGGFVIAKATGDPAAAIDAIDHLTRYLTFLFDRGEAHHDRRGRREGGSGGAGRGDAGARCQGGDAPLRGRRVDRGSRAAASA